MDSTPPYHHNRSEPKSRTKSVSRLSQTEEIPHLAVSLIGSSPKPTPSPSTLSLKFPTSLPLQELLPLSPSPLRRSAKARLTDRLEMADESVIEPVGSRRRCRSRAAQLGLMGCASPRNVRRSRRRSELDASKEEKDMGLAEDVGKPRKRRHSTRSKKEKLSLVPSSVPSSSSSPSESQMFCFLHYNITLSNFFCFL